MDCDATGKLDASCQPGMDPDCTQQYPRTDGLCYEAAIPLQLGGDPTVYGNPGNVAGCEEVARCRV